MVFERRSQCFLCAEDNATCEPSQNRGIFGSLDFAMVFCNLAGYNPGLISLSLALLSIGMVLPLLFSPDLRTERTKIASRNRSDSRSEFAESNHNRWRWTF